MPTLNYNFPSPWTLPELLARYAHLATQLHIPPRDLSPTLTTDAVATRIYPVLFNIIAGIKSHDPACIALGIELLESDAKLPFGKILKSNTARALRHAPLTDSQKSRLRRRILSMLAAAAIPREFSDYAKLLRHITFTPAALAAVEPNLDLNNPFVAKFYKYFQQALAQDPANY